MEAEEVQVMKRGRGRPPRVKRGGGGDCHSKEVPEVERDRDRHPFRQQSMPTTQKESTPKIRGSFYKIIMPSSGHENMLSLPSKFTMRFKDEFSSNALLIVPSDKTWNVKLHKEEDNCFLFSDGWQEFQEYYTLPTGSFIVFDYVGNSNFMVTIYDFHCCEIHYSSRRDKVLETCTRKHSANKKPCKQGTTGCQKGLNMPPSRYRRNEGDADVMHRTEGRFDDDVKLLETCSRKPSASKSCKQGTIGCNKGLNMPPSRYLKNDGVADVMHTTEGRFDDDGSHGCKISDKSPCEDDAEVADWISEDEALEFDKERKDHVAVARNHARFKAKDETSFRIEEKSEPLGGPKQREYELKGKETMEIKHDENALSAAEAYSRNSEYPSFVFVIKSYNCSMSKSCCATIPTLFSLKYIKSRPQYIQLETIDGRRWSVKCCIWGKARTMSHGWRQFAGDNNLKEGDVCVFVLINTTGVVFKVLVFRGHE